MILVIDTKPIFLKNNMFLSRVFYRFSAFIEHPLIYFVQNSKVLTMSHNCQRSERYPIVITYGHKFCVRRTLKSVDLDIPVIFSTCLYE